MKAITTRTIPFRFAPAIAAVTMLVAIATSQRCQAASDCDVTKAACKGWGTLQGRFVLKGDLPKTGEIQLIRDFAKLNYKAPDESLQVDRKTRGIANVMVFVCSPNVAVHPDYADTIKTPRVMKYAGPRLIPRVTSLHVNQPLDFRNANPFGHAVWIEPSANPKSVFVIPGKKNIKTNTFAHPEPRPLKIRDPVHSLSPFGWIIVADHPYVAITDASGRFELKNLPAGQLEFQCWHERVGWLAARPSWKDGRFTFTVTAGKKHDLGDVSVSSTLFHTKVSVDAN